MNTLTMIVLITLSVTGALYALDNDKNYEQEHYKSYCEMVAIWEADKAAGVYPSKRKGWPPYNKQIDCSGE